MDISTRAENMPQSPIRKLAKYSDAAKRNGIHVYHLNIGQPDILTPPCAIEAVHNMDRSILDYSPSQGTQSLRTKMVGYYAEYDSGDIHLQHSELSTGGWFHYLHLPTLPEPLSIARRLIDHWLLCGRKP